MDNLFDLPLEKESNLLRKFEEIHDFIYSNDGLSPQQTLEEFIKILFIKILDESRNLRKFSIDSQQWLNIRNGNNAENVLFEIENLFELTKEEFNSVFDYDEKIKLSLLSLGFIVSKLQNISLTDSSKDAKGLAFQKFLTNNEKNGRGQFFTPEPVVEFCVQMLSPQKHEKILDPACGSGGFLISALNYIKVNNDDVDINKLISSDLFGVDISKSIARIAKMKLLLEHNIKSQIFCSNSLDDLDAHKLLLNCPGGFDLILTNPPFGAKITQNSLLEKYILGYKWNKTPDSHLINRSTLLTAQTAENLFIERCLDLLKVGGRMAIVLPNGNFENSSLEYVRSFIMKTAKILAIITLPQETFIPFGTGVKTSLMFIEKKEAEVSEEYNVFFGRVTKIGYQGNKNGTPIYKKDKYGNLLNKDWMPIIDEDFTDILNSYRNFINNKDFETNNSFSIRSSEIKGRLDFDFYSPENRRLISNMSKNKTVKLSEISDIVKVKSNKLKMSTGKLNYVELSDINTHSFEIINSTTLDVYELPSRASFELLEGDIITAVAGNSVGTRKHATALVAEEYAGSICTNGFRVLRNFKINPYYLLFYMKTEKFLKQMFMYRTGAAIPAVSDNDFSNIIIEIPDNEELERIVSKIQKAFNLRNEAKKEIESIMKKVS